MPPTEPSSQVSDDKFINIARMCGGAALLTLAALFLSTVHIPGAGLTATLVCSGGAGTCADNTTGDAAYPTLAIMADPKQVASGQTSTISWESALSAIVDSISNISCFGNATQACASYSTLNSYQALYNPSNGLYATSINAFVVGGQTYALQTADNAGYGYSRLYKYMPNGGTNCPSAGTAPGLGDGTNCAKNNKDSAYQYVTTTDGMDSATFVNGPDTYVALANFGGLDLYKWTTSGTTITPGTGTGLKGEYANNRSFTTADTISGTPVLTRTDATVNFNWVASSPSPGVVNVDDFSARWTGTVVAPVAGGANSYSFQIIADDGVRLFIDGVRVIDWTTNGSYTLPSAVTLNQKMNIRVEYYEVGGNASVQLLWKNPNTAGLFAVIPQTALFPVVDASFPCLGNGTLCGIPTQNIPRYPDGSNFVGGSDPSHMDIPPRYVETFTTAGDANQYFLVSTAQGNGYAPIYKWTNPTLDTSVPGTGLQGNYYNNTTFDFVPVATANPSGAINFTGWGSGSPAAGVNSTSFGLRLTGTIKAPVNGLYTFTLDPGSGASYRSNGSVLYIDGALIINNWPGGAPASANLWLAAGSHSIRIDYAKGSRFESAKLILSWAYPGQATQVVPVANLYPTSTFGAPCMGNGLSCGVPIETLNADPYKWKVFKDPSGNAYVTTGNKSYDRGYIYKWMPAGTPASNIAGCFGNGTNDCTTWYQQVYVRDADSTRGPMTVTAHSIGSTPYVTYSTMPNGSAFVSVFTWTSYAVGNGCPNPGGGLGSGVTATGCGDGNSFGKEYQYMVTSGATGEIYDQLDTFTALGDTYLTASANHNDSGGNSFSKSAVYKWSPAGGTNCPVNGGWGDGSTCGNSSTVAVYQDFSPGDHVDRMQGITLGSDVYIAHSNYYSYGAPVGNISFLFRAISKPCYGNGSSCGSVFQNTTSDSYNYNPSAVDVFSPDAGVTTYLAQSNLNGSYAKIYKWMSGGCTGAGDGTNCGPAYQYLPSSIGEDAQAFSNAGTTYLVIGDKENVGTTQRSHMFKWMTALCPAGSTLLSSNLTNYAAAWSRLSGGLPGGWNNLAAPGGTWVAPTDEGVYNSWPWNGSLGPLPAGTDAHMIWSRDSRGSGDTNTTYFRLTFTPSNATEVLTIGDDDQVYAYIAGPNYGDGSTAVSIATNTDYTKFKTVTLNNLNTSATYVLSFKVVNTGGPGGLGVDLHAATGAGFGDGYTCSAPYQGIANPNNDTGEITSFNLNPSFADPSPYVIYANQTLDSGGVWSGVSQAFKWTNPGNPGAVGAGTGLYGEYFNTNLFYSTQGVPTLTKNNDSGGGGLNWDWGGGSPGAGLASNGFSVRWTGTLDAPVAGTYTFTIHSDDGEKVWIDDTLLSDRLESNVVDDTGLTRTFTANTQHSIRIDYKQVGGGNSFRMQWSYPGQPTTVVPTMYLHPNYPQTSASNPGVGTPCIGNGHGCGVPFQTLMPNEHNTRWLSFNVAADTYIVGANYGTNQQPVYKWMNGSGCFGDGASTCGATYQTIYTASGAVGVATSTDGTNVYVTFSSNNVDVYKWSVGNANCPTMGKPGFGTGADCKNAPADESFTYQKFSHSGYLAADVFTDNQNKQTLVINGAVGSTPNIDVYVWTASGTSCPSAGAGPGWGDGTKCASGPSNRYSQRLSLNYVNRMKGFVVGSNAYLAAAPYATQISLYQMSSTGGGYTPSCSVLLGPAFTTAVAVGDSGTYITPSVTSEQDYKLSCTLLGGGTSVTNQVAVTPIIPVTVSVSSAIDPTATEASGDTGTFRITRTGSTAAALPVVIVFTTGGNNAVNGTDYNPITSPVSISAGSSFVDVIVTPIQDSVYEGTEPVTMTIQDPGDGSYVVPTDGTQTATVNITDDDGTVVPPQAFNPCAGSAVGSCVLGLSPNKVRKAGATTVSWNITGLATGANGNSGSSCRITTTPSIFSTGCGFGAYASCGATWANSALVSNIQQQTNFVLSCTSPDGTNTKTSPPATVTIIPSFQEI